MRDQQRAASTSADAALASNPAHAAEGTEGAEDDRRKEKVMSCLTCTLCDELYREATTITECMHSFCKVCIDSKLRFKSSTNKCPVCGIPLSGDPYGVGQLKYDGVLDDIVTKLFPRDGDAERAIVRDKRLAEERAFLKARRTRRNRRSTRRGRSLMTGRRPRQRGNRAPKWPWPPFQRWKLRLILRRSCLRWRCRCLRPWGGKGKSPHQ